MIYTLGESLMDVIHTHDGKTVCKPGGSMLNVAVSLSRAGNEVSLISELGDDNTGKQLMDFLHENSIRTGFITEYRQSNTSKAIATLDENSKPSYVFQKSYPSERKLHKPPIFTTNDTLILGSIYSRDPEIKSFIDKYLQAVKRGGAMLVFDPNVRHNHQLKEDVRRKMLLKNFTYADVIKGSDEDFYNIFQLSDPVKINATLRTINKHALICITLGAYGSKAYYNGFEASYVPGKIVPVSTIGAGDAFTAGMVSFIVKNGLSLTVNKLSENDLRKILQEASRFASLVCRSYDNYISVRN